MCVRWRSGRLIFSIIAVVHVPESSALTRLRRSPVPSFASWNDVQQEVLKKDVRPDPQDSQAADAVPAMRHREETNISSGWPFISSMLQRLWPFMICEAALATLALMGWSLFRTLDWRAPIAQPQVLECQLQFFFALLMCCPVLRTVAVVQNFTILWAFAARTLIEAIVVLLVFCAFPALLVAYTSRCAAMREDPPTAASIHLSPMGRAIVHQRHAEEAEMKAEIGKRSSALLMRIRGLRFPLIGLMALRVAIQLFRLIAISAYGFDEQRWLKVTYSFVSLLLLISAFALAMWRYRQAVGTCSDRLPPGLHSFLDASWGSRLHLGFVQCVVAGLLVFAQVQDLMFLLVFGVESVAQIYSGCLFIHEVAMAAFACVVVCELNKLSACWAKSQASMPMKQRALSLLQPHWLFPPESTDTPMALTFSPESSSIYSCCEPSPEEANGLQQGTHTKRSSWQLVLFDTFTPRVRSRLLPALMLGLLLAESFKSFAQFTSVIQEAIPNPYAAAVVLALSLVILAFATWLYGGIALLGNNIFMPKYWLFVTFLAFALELFLFGSRFLDPEHVQATGAFGMLQVAVYTWINFSASCVALCGAFHTIEVMLREDADSEFLKSKGAVRHYVSHRLQEKKAAAHNVYRAAVDYLPPLLVAGAVATVIVDLAFVLCAVYCGQELIHHARVWQTFALALNGTAASGGFVQVLDTNFDQELSHNEVGLPSVMFLLGMPQLTTALNALWEDVDENENRRLSIDEVRNFLKHVSVMGAAFRSWLKGDPSVAAQQLELALDSSPHDGALTPTELPFADLKRMLHAASPLLGDLVGPEIPLLWREADTNMDGKLNVDELSAFIGILKARVAVLEAALRSVSLEFVQAGGRILANDSEKRAQLHLLVDLRSQVEATTGVSEATLGNQGTLGEGTREVISAWRKHFGRSAASSSCSPSSPCSSSVSISSSSSSRRRRRKWRRRRYFIRDVAARLAEDLGAIVKDGKADASAARGVLFSSLHALSPALAEKARKSVLEPALFLAQNKAQGSSIGDEDENQDRNKGYELMNADLPLYNSLPHIVESLMPDLQDGVAKALLVLNVLDLPIDQAAKTVVQALDTQPPLGRLDVHELGLTYMLSFISPQLTARVPDLMQYAGAKDGTVGEEQVALLLRFVQSLIRDHVGDVDGDGEVTKRDLLVTIQTATGQMGRDPGASLLQQTDGKVRQPDAVPSMFTPGVSQLGENSGMGSQVTAAMKGLVGFFASVNLSRIEACLYAAALLSMVFGLWIVGCTFAGYVRIFEMMQRGDSNFEGSTHMKDFMRAPDKGTFFPGMLFSTVLFGILLSFVICFVLLVFCTSLDFWTWAWGYARIPVFSIACTFFLQYFLLRKFLLNWYCMHNREVVHPQMFACVWGMLTMVNFALGTILSLTRLVTIVPFAFMEYHRLDKTLLDEEWVPMDSGITSYLTTVALSYQNLNPVRSAFISTLLPDPHRLHGPVPSDVPQLKAAAPEGLGGGAPRYTKVRRNKWWLMKLLWMNPSLIPHRCRPGNGDTPGEAQAPPPMMATGGPPVGVVGPGGPPGGAVGRIPRPAVR